MAIYILVNIKWMYTRPRKVASMRWTYAVANNNDGGKCTSRWEFYDKSVGKYHPHIIKTINDLCCIWWSWCFTLLLLQLVLYSTKGLVILWHSFNFRLVVHSELPQGQNFRKKVYQSSKKMIVSKCVWIPKSWPWLKRNTGAQCAVHLSWQLEMVMSNSVHIRDFT